MITSDKSLTSVSLEKRAIAGLLKYPDMYHDISQFASEKDFANEVHKIIFSILKLVIESGEVFDRVIIGERIQKLGVKFKDNLNIVEYLETLERSQITEAGAKKTFAELFDLRVRRDIADKAQEIYEYLHNNRNDPIEKTISHCDTIYNSSISKFVDSEEAVNIFDHIEEWVEERGNNPVEEVGYEVPYTEFQRLYGGLRKGNLYAIVARPGQGKSTFINDIVFGSCRLSGFKVAGLCLDTEMFTKDTAFRMIAALTNVPFYYIETGAWRKNAEFSKRVREYWSIIKQDKLKYYHFHVRNKNIDEITSFTRRWVKKHAPNGEAIVAYDYIKLTAEKLEKHWAEHQAMGDKVDKLKKLAEELNIPIITAMQLNRSGENQNKKSSEVVDDSSVISLTDRLQWYASFIAIFRRKTMDELVDDGLEFGTHKLIPTKTRFQGRDAVGHFDLVKREMGAKTKYVSNYLNFKVDNFDIEEKGSLRDIIAKELERKDIQKNSKNKEAEDANL